MWRDRPRDYAHLHAIDGGYFDNSGLVALTEWLNEALEERAKVNRQPSTQRKYSYSKSAGSQKEPLRTPRNSEVGFINFTPHSRLCSEFGRSAKPRRMLPNLIFFRNIGAEEELN